MAPAHPVSGRPRHLSRRAAVLFGLTGIIAAIAVIGASHASTAPAAGEPAVHATASPSASVPGSPMAR